VLRDRFGEREQYVDDRAEELAWIASLEPGRVLDVGCGPGWMLAAMSDKWIKVGVDTSKKAIAAAQDLGLFAFHGDIDSPNVPMNSFDLVIHYHVIEHVRDPIAEMVRIIEVLKRDGRLLLGTPDFGGPCAERFGKRYRMLHDPTHRNLFTRESMHRFLTDYGFDVERIGYPFPDRFATASTFARWHDVEKTSPPWPGNWMTFYCRRSMS